MKGYVFAAGEGTEELKPVRHLRQVYEFFKERSDPRTKNEKLVFSLGEGECQLVFTCQATIGRHYYFAISSEFVEHSSQTVHRFHIVHRHAWDQGSTSAYNQQITYDKELSQSLPGFIHFSEGYWKYMEGDWEEGMAILQAYGFTWCESLEEWVCDAK
jgi:hypothetical protein